MGSALSSESERGRDTDVTSESETMNTDASSSNETTEEEYHDAREDEERTRAKEEEMNEFKKQLSIKREQRREILARHRAEKEDLEKALNNEKSSKLELCQKNDQLRKLLLKNNIDIPENLHTPTEASQLSEIIVQMKEELGKLRSDNIKLRRDLIDANKSLQNAYSDIAVMNGHNLESMKQIQALKEVVSVSKTLINLREGQLNELKEKLGEIERSLSEREASMLSADLRQEYERQLQNIRTLRGLYEERARLAEVTRQGLVRDLEEQKALYKIESDKCKDLVEKVVTLEAKVEALEETIDSKNHDIAMYRDETNAMKAEMAVVNKLFSQVLLGYKTKHDLDKLVLRLEENHGLLTHMAENEDDAEASSALPKLLLELVSQVDEYEEHNEPSKSEESLPAKEEQSFEKNVPAPSTTAEEIVENLPKVWRVLMELLSHQTVADDPSDKVTTCYKSVETNSGPVLVPSVSQTYIRLKDLIVEKLGLVKEVNRMKQLNNHLENRLQEQEKRLCLVTTELSKTWHVVGKLRRHHYQLHTHEKILKYELQQKRKLLNELKEELEYCREKWDQAREKNTQSERDWRILRAEFSSRKIKTGSPSFNNSGESGYSDERQSDESSESNDESEYVKEPLNRCKKKFKKSFDNSSAECNLAAEREDPVSDMLDVADLSLDTQDSEECHEALSESSKSENIVKSEKTCETEDEIGDITHDDVMTDDSIKTQVQIDDKNVASAGNHQETNTSPSTSNYSSGQLIDPAIILQNIKKQNEGLAKKDARLEQLEKSTALLLKKTQTTAKVSEEIDHSLDCHISRSSSYSVPQNAEAGSQQLREQQFATSDVLKETKELLKEEGNSTQTNNFILNNEIECGIANADDATSPENHIISQENNYKQEFGGPPIITTNFQAILENITSQNERLTQKVERLQRLETGCTEVVQNISNTLISGEAVIEKLDSLHSKHGESKHTDAENNNILEQTSDKSNENDYSEPSTSGNANHAARFAARDKRLKRLEEQTKSLVKKVNKTTSKGVKINYKLDELHNIYGSESSRAGTPSEDTEDRSIDEDDDDSTIE